MLRPRLEASNCRALRPPYAASVTIQWWAEPPYKLDKIMALWYGDSPTCPSCRKPTHFLPHYRPPGLFAINWGY